VYLLQLLKHMYIFMFVRNYTYRNTHIYIQRRSAEFTVKE